MAEVQVNQDSSGIKLFGKTIVVKVGQVIKDDLDHDDKKNGDDPTVGKRPDKIIPCPRCRSMETKFCYFNNYNVNQPRHFCKGCQRYWTAGGALRNVPVGAGRRKAKPQCRGGFTSLSESCLYEISHGVHQFDYDRVVDEWEMAEHSGFQHVFPAKRRRSSCSSGQTC